MVVIGWRRALGHLVISIELVTSSTAEERRTGLIPRSIGDLSKPCCFSAALCWTHLLFSDIEETCQSHPVPKIGSKIINNDCFQVKYFSACFCKCSRCRDPEHEHIPKLCRLTHNLHPHCIYLPELPQEGILTSHTSFPHSFPFAAADHGVTYPAHASLCSVAMTGWWYYPCALFYFHLSFLCSVIYLGRVSWNASSCFKEASSLT